MPTFDSTQYGKFVGDPRQALKANEWGGRVRVRYSEFTGDAAQNDFVNLFPIRKGERPLAFIEDHTAFGASVTMDLGIAGAENKYVSALSVAAAGRSVQVSLSTAEETAEAVVQAKLEGADPASGTLKVAMIYVID